MMLKKTILIIGIMVLNVFGAHYYFDTQNKNNKNDKTLDKNDYILELKENKDFSSLSKQLHTFYVWGKEEKEKKETADTDTAKKEMITMQLKGIILDNNHYYALLFNKKENKTDRYAVNTKLNDTTSIITITKDLLEIKNQDTIQKIYLFKENNEFSF